MVVESVVGWLAEMVESAALSWNPTCEASDSDLALVDAVTLC